MNLLLSGICLFVSIGCLTYMAWRFLRQQDYRKALIVILLIGLSVRIIGAKDPYLHAWDERYHALVAKNLIQHPLTPTLIEKPLLDFDNQDWVGSNIWLGKPSLPLWMMSGSIALLGNNLLAVRLPSVLLGLLSIWLTFLIGRKLFDSRTGLLAAYFHAINGLLIELIGGRVSSDHVEVCFITMVELAVYFLVVKSKPDGGGRNVFFAGVFMGLAFLSKWYPAFIVAPVWFTFLVTKEQWHWRMFFREGLLLFAGFLITAVPWTWYMLQSHPEEMNAILFNALTAYSSTVQSHAAPFYYFFHKIMVIYGELIYLALGYFVYRTVKAENRYPYMGVLVWLFVPLFVFTFADTKRFTYMLIAAPAFFIIPAWFWFYLRDEYLNARMRWLNGILLVAFIVLPLRYMVDRSKLFGGDELVPAFYQLSEAERGKLTDRTVVFGTDDYIEMMFHTDVYVAYRRIPSASRLKTLQAEGFTILIWNEGKLNSWGG